MSNDPDGDARVMAGDTRIIGVDFDNTLVDYRDAFHSAAVERALIRPSTGKSKNGIRDRIRRLPDGEIEWQKLQALVYGLRIGDAKLFHGVGDFFAQCNRNGVRVYIVSHKAEFVTYNEAQVNLRTSALAWMTAHDFFRAKGLALSPGAVFFASTREEKIQRIRALGCTHFIDDLEETFMEVSFPRDVEKILFTPHRKHLASAGMRVITTWQEICEYFFAARI